MSDGLRHDVDEANRAYDPATRELQKAIDLVSVAKLVDGHVTLENWKMACGALMRFADASSALVMAQIRLIDHLTDRLKIRE